MHSNKESQVAVQQMKRKVEEMRDHVEAKGHWVLLLQIGLPLFSLGLFAVGVLIQRENTEKRTSRLFYELGEAQQQRYSVVQQTVSHLAKSQQIWRVEGISSTSDWKRNAGASSLVRRAPISSWAPPIRPGLRLTLQCHY